MSKRKALSKLIRGEQRTYWESKYHSTPQTNHRSLHLIVHQVEVLVLSIPPDLYMPKGEMLSNRADAQVDRRYWSSRMKTLNCLQPELNYRV